MLDKKAQVADTTTWIVATLIIVVVLSIGIFATNFVSSDKTIIFLDDKKKDFLVGESLLAFLQTKINGETVFNLLKEKEIDEKVKSLAENVFRIHKKDYQIFVRLYNKDNTEWVEVIEPQGAITDKRLKFTSNRIKLEDDKYISVQLFEKAK